MRISLFLPALLLAFGALRAAEPDTALGALKFLPKGQAKFLARIEARDGTPAPVRWHLLVHDKTAENGLREYVVAAGELVASRNLSQFSEGLSAADVIGSEVLKIDSDRVAKLVIEYARANDLVVNTLQYRLRKEGAEASPLWQVTALDHAGKELGSLVVAAGKGTVISHDGFSIEPLLADEKTDSFKVQTNPQAGPVAEAKGRKRRPEAEEEPAKGTFFRRVGGSMQKFFTGKDSISR